ncbi:MAG TPA: hypothetical protein VGS07_13470 [Thermoanaerobaculia bacterium]|nr:hypothetical protein [Thermoanaerobaculia bacterium]
MKTAQRLRFLPVLGFLALAAGTPAAHAALWPDGHVDQAETWIFNPYIDPANNLWGEPASITVDANGEILHATAKCGSFTALLLKAAYSGVITDQVLKDLTGFASPYALNWYTAIQAEKTSASGFTSGPPWQACSPATSWPRPTPRAAIPGT